MLHFCLKISELLRVLSLVHRCVKMRVCKHRCDVLDSHLFLRNILLIKSNRGPFLFQYLHSLMKQEGGWESF